MYHIILSNRNSFGCRISFLQFSLAHFSNKSGTFPYIVKHNFNDYLAKVNNIDSMAEIMLYYIDNPLPDENIKASSQNMSWGNYVEAILNRDF